MLDSIIFLLEKIETYTNNCTSKWWWVARILTSPISLIGLLFIQTGIFMKWCKNQLEIVLENDKKDDINYRLGFCPKCGVGVFIREKRPDGDDICANGHKYPSKESLKEFPKK